MTAGTLSLGESFSTGIQAVTRNFGWAILGTFIMLLIQFVGGMIPVLGFLFSMFLGFVFTAGYLAFALRMNRSADAPPLEALFSGFNRYVPLLGATWLYIAIYIGCLIPGLFLIIPGSMLLDGGNEFLGAILVMIGVLFSVAVYVYIAMHYVFVYLIIIDSPSPVGVFDAFTKSSAMARGRRWHLLLCLIVLGLFSSIGFLLFFVGALFTIPVATCALAALYQQLGGDAAHEAQTETMEPEALPAGDT